MYVDVNTAGLLSSKPPVAVHGKDAHCAIPTGVRSTFLVFIGERLPLGLVKISGEKSSVYGNVVPFPIVIVAVSDVEL